MKPIPSVVALLAALSLSALGKDDEAGAAAARPVGAAEAVKAHFRHFIDGRFEEMAGSYAARVQLMPGHEMLKPEYGLGDADTRKTGATIDSAALIAAMEKAFGGKPVVNPDLVEKLFELFRFEALKTEPGDYAVDPPDPVDTPDGKVHFTIMEGDSLFKVGPEKGDFLLFQLRQSGGRWQVVAELLD